MPTGLPAYCCQAPLESSGYLSGTVCLNALNFSVSTSKPRNSSGEDMEDIHRLPSGATTTVCVPACFSGHLYSFRIPVAGSTEASLAGTFLASSVIHRIPSLPTIGVCGTDFGEGTGYSVNFCVAMSKRPTLFER